MGGKLAIKIYHGFGHTHDITVFGHVFRKEIVLRDSKSRNIFKNLLGVARLFFVKPLPNIPVQLIWNGQIVNATTESDGFFRFEWTALQETTAGWHTVIVNSIDTNGKVNGTATGDVFIPHKTQYGFISDIDDTIMISHSATRFRRIRELLFKNPRNRIVFTNAPEHYELLAMAHTTIDTPNPFFYVSSSEWNLYDYLQAVFKYNKMPPGAFLLNQVKQWYELWKTGKTKHEGKMLRILRLFTLFPEQTFILFGDNSQSDPAIYTKLSEKYADRIFAVYIRNVSGKNEAVTKDLLAVLESRNVHTCFFTESAEAIVHSRKVGLIE